MKKLLFIGATGLLLFGVSCKDTDSSTTTTTTQNEKNKENTKMIYRAMETGDVSKLDSIIDEDIIDHGNPMGDVKGRDSVKAFFVSFHKNVKDIKIESIANASDGDYNFDLNRSRGTTTADFMGMPAGTAFDMTSVDVVKIKNGKAVEHWGFMDPREMMKMQGGANNKMDMKKAGKMDPSKMDTTKK